MHIIVGGLKDKNYLVSYIQLPPSFVVCILKYRPQIRGNALTAWMGYLKHDPAGNEEALDLLEILHSFLTKLENEAIAEIMQKAEGVKRKR